VEVTFNSMLTQSFVGDLEDVWWFELELLDDLVDGRPQQHTGAPPFRFRSNWIVPDDLHLRVEPRVPRLHPGERHRRRTDVRGIGMDRRGQVDPQYERRGIDRLEHRVVRRVV